MERPASLPLPLPGPLMRWLAGVGRAYQVTLEHAGGLGILSWQIVRAVVRLKVSFREIVSQLYATGIQSIPIVIVTASLAGIVTSQQGGYQFQGSVPLSLTPAIMISGTSTKISTEEISSRLMMGCLA